MNRTDLHALADGRVTDAEVLMESERWAAAYYLLGYAVECALKVCIARQFRHEEVPEKALINDFYSHRLDKLLAIAGLQATLDERTKAEPAFRENWNMVCTWSEASRYEHRTPEEAARRMLVAVVNSDVGVLPWLKIHW